VRLQKLAGWGKARDGTRLLVHDGGFVITSGGCHLCGTPAVLAVAGEVWRLHLGDASLESVPRPSEGTCANGCKQREPGDDGCDE